MHQFVLAVVKRTGLQFALIWVSSTTALAFFDRLPQALVQETRTEAVRRRFGWRLRRRCGRCWHVGLCRLLRTAKHCRAEGALGPQTRSRRRSRHAWQAVWTLGEMGRLSGSLFGIKYLVALWLRLFHISRTGREQTVRLRGLSRRNFFAQQDVIVRVRCVCRHMRTS